MAGKYYKKETFANSIRVELEGVGPVLFERSKRAKRLSISVKPFRGVRVAVPRGYSLYHARRVVSQKAGWIQENLRKVRRIEAGHEITIVDSSNLDYAEASQKLIRRLDDLADRFGFSYNRVTIRNQKTRWGSCSANNDISLNMKLVKLPDELRDYIILHELVHTRIKNHSRAYWAELDKYVGNAKRIDAQLRYYHLAP